MNKESYQKVSLTVWDVIKMTEDEFLRLSVIPNWQKIRIDANVPYISLSGCIIEFNQEIYNKYKLLFDEVKDDDDDDDDNINDVFEGKDQDLVRKISKIIGNIEKQKKRVKFYQPNYVETYEINGDDDEDEYEYDDNTWG